jgi:hypothetical protein
MSTIVNKVPYDFCSLEFEFTANGGETFGILEGIDSLDYKVKMNRTKLYGTSRLPIDMTDGDIDADSSITFLKSWFDYISAKARELKIPLAQLEMTGTVNYQHRGEVMHTDTLSQVRFAEIGHSLSKGPDPLMVVCPLILLNVYYDGVDVLGNTL